MNEEEELEEQWKTVVIKNVEWNYEVSNLGNRYLV